MPRPSGPRERARAFCDRFGTGIPICEAPMAGSSPPRRAAAVAAAGAMAGFGAYTAAPEAIRAWALDFRSAAGDAPLQVNLWLLGPPPGRDAAREAAMRDFLASWGPPPPEPVDERLPDFEAQCRALLDVRPRVASSTMGLFPPVFAAELRAAGIAWFATVTTLAEAIAAAEAGADAVIAQGIEAGGHRASFNSRVAASGGVGLVSLVPQIADRLAVPVIAAGGIADPRGIAAALILGASAVQIGTALLRTPESETPAAWADGLAAAKPEGTCVTRAFSGRAGRALVTDFLRDPAMPEPADFPVQRALTAGIRAAHDPRSMQAWAGQSAAMAPATPAEPLVRGWWRGAEALLTG